MAAPGQNNTILSVVVMTMADTQKPNSLRKVVNKCNSFILPGSTRPGCLVFYVNSVAVGLIRQDILKQLKAYPDVFILNDKEKGDQGQPRGLHLSQDLDTFEKRTKKIEQVLRSLQQKDALVSLRGWRDECYSISTGFGVEPLLKVERAAACLFGVSQYGVHVNGYVVDDFGDILMWIGQRSRTKQTYPNMWDNLCAGGLSSGLGVEECAIKEAQEEADISEEHLENLQAVGCISYMYEDERGIFPECQFVFDLQLPDDFIPRNTDGEMQDFKLLPVNKLRELILNEDFKPNCALVIVDFLIRHGILTPDNEPDYTYLVEMMHISHRSYITDPATVATAQ
ncbi:hypothetical protein ScPMuIL_008764 [Solemya velum]